MHSIQNKCIIKCKLDILCILIIILSVASEICDSSDNDNNFNTKNIIIFEPPYLSKNSHYFGLSLLLQNGNSSTLFVGAPKFNNSGSLFKCDINNRLQNVSCGVISIDTPSSSSKKKMFDLLGWTLDGSDYENGPVYVCAPRKLNGKTYFNLKGTCYEFKNGIVTRKYSSLQNERLFKDGSNMYAFGLAGFHMRYMKTEKKLLLGAPSVRCFQGAFILQPTSTSFSTILPKQNDQIHCNPNSLRLRKQDNYLGYAVGYGRFRNDSSNIWYLIGAPRDGSLFGKIYIYEKNSKSYVKEVLSFTGEEFGSYFGSSLLVYSIGKRKFADALFVGAPMASGKSFDEGYVSYYQNSYKGDIKFMKKLTGSKSFGGRFGSSISGLGDIDLDSFNDIAISAPFENEIGSVYIFKGCADGISTLYNQKLAPIPFSVPIPRNVSGFGLGMSRGNDIDKNGFNDLAIGAFKSDMVFIFKSKLVVEYELNLISLSNQFLKPGTNLIFLTICFSYRHRSLLNKNPLNFTLLLKTVENNNIDKQDFFKITEKIPNCGKHQIPISRNKGNKSPLRLVFWITPFDPADFTVVGEELQTTIPFSEECNNRTCQTNLIAAVSSKTQEIVLEVTNEFSVTVLVENEGETAHQCQIFISNIPDGVEFRNLQSCQDHNSTYSCFLADELRYSENVSAIFKFDIKGLDPSLEQLQIDFSVKSLDENLKFGKSSNSLVLPVKLDNSPYVKGLSNPESYEYVYTKNLDNPVEFWHILEISNFGPSPFKPNISLLLPNLSHLDFKIAEAKISSNNIVKYCLTSSYDFDNEVINEKYSNFSNLFFENSTIVMSCFENTTEPIECVQINCEGDYLHTSENAIISVKIVSRFGLLAEKHKKLLGKSKRKFIYQSVAYFANKTATFSIQTSTTIYVSLSQKIAIWVYLAASVGGVLLLIILIVLLYKCHFFDRKYKQKLMKEKRISQKLISDSVLGAGLGTQSVLEEFEFSSN